jgi:hypothetical protein
MLHDPERERLSDDAEYQRNPWEEYERIKRVLPSMRPGEYEREIRKICEELGI